MTLPLHRCLLLFGIVTGASLSFTSFLRRGFLVLMLSFMFSSDGFSQITYSTDFNGCNAATCNDWNVSGGWGSGTISISTAGYPCSNSAALSNIYGSATQTILRRTTSLGTSNGQPCSLSFDYRAYNYGGNPTSNPTPSNSCTFTGQWATSATGPWNTISSFNNVSSSNCQSHTFSAFTPTSGQPIFVRIVADRTSGDFWLIRDNISFTQAAASYAASYTSMSTGSSTWCAGETRNVSVTITNTGTQPWTDGGGEDFNIGVKWNADADYFVRVDAQNLAAGASRTYTLSVTAPATPATNNLTFNVVREAVAWFGGPYVSPTINIAQVPSQPSAVSGSTNPCQGSTQTYSVTNVGGVTYAWSLPSGWSGSSTTNSISVTAGSGSGNISVTPSNSCGTGTTRTLAVSPIAVPSNDPCGSATSLIIGNSAISGSLTCSNSESPFSGNGDVWYQFTPSCTGTHSISLTGLPNDKDLYVYSSCGTTSSIGSSTAGGSSNETITQSFTGGLTYYIRVFDYNGSGGSFNIAVTSSAPPPSQPSAIVGLTNPEVGSSQNYSVTNVGGVTYTWAFPSGWTITGGQGTNSVTVTVGGSNGTVSVTPSNACGNGTARTLSTNIPNYRAKFISMNYGSGTWCAGTSRNVEVTIQNTGVSTWNSAFTTNVGVKWNTNGGNWADYYVRTSAGSLSSGAQQTYTLAVQARNATAGPVYGTNLATGTNNLTFDVVNEASCWFGNNNGSCGPGNSVYTSPTITITDTPAQPSAISGPTDPCQGNSQTYSVTNVSGVTYAWVLPSGWSGASTTNSISVTVGSASGTVSVTPSNACGNGTPSTLSVTAPATPTNPGTVTTSAISCSQLTLSWGAATNASGYEIQVSTVSNFSSSVSTYNGSTNEGNILTKVISGLSPNTQYWIRVRARNGSLPCRSSWTTLDITSVTTAALPIAPVLSLSATNICIGSTVSATLQTAGSGGVGCSASYEYRVDGVNWQAYTLGTPITALASYPSIQFRAVWGGCSGSGCADDENIYAVNINQPPTLSLTSLTNATICDEGAITFNVNGGTAPFTYTWAGSNGYTSSGSIASNAQAISISNLTGATYTLTVNDGASCSYSVAQSQIVTAPWVADAGPDVSTCSFPVSLNGDYSGLLASNSATVNIGTYDDGSSERGFGYGCYDYGWSRNIYTESEVGQSGDITSIRVYVENASNNYTLFNQQIYIKNIGAFSSYTNYADGGWIDPTINGYTLVYNGDITYSSTNGWQEIPLSTPFPYSGTGNLEVFWVNNDGNFSCSGDPQYRYEIDYSAYWSTRDYRDGTFPTTDWNFNRFSNHYWMSFIIEDDPTPSYTWEGPSPIGTFSTNQNTTASQAGTYTLNVTSNGCTVSDQVVIYEPTIPPVPTVSNTGPVCSGNTVDLTASGMAPGGKVANLTGTQTMSGADPSYNGTLNNHTVEFWANPTKAIVINAEANTGITGSLTGAPQSFATFPSNGGGSGNAGIGVSVGTNGVSVYQHASGHFPATLVYPTTISGWTHITVVHQGDVPYLYINGALVKVGLSSTKNTYPSANISGGYGYYAGSLDNVRIWNDVRTQAEIAGSMYLEAPVSSAGLIGHYTFNASNGSAIVGTNNGSSSATYPNADYYTYTWSGTGVPAASINETQTTSALPSTPTSQNYTVTATAGGCSGTSSAPTTVTLNPTAGITDVTASATGSLCSSATINVTAVGVVGSLNWYSGPNGTGTNFGTANPLNGVPPGTYYARVTGSCGSPVEDFISVTQLADVGTPTFTVGPASVCQDAANTTYTATATNTSGITYSVSPAGAGTIGSSSGVMNWNAAFSGTATITASASGCNGPQTFDLDVEVNPSLPASVSISASVNTICPGTSVTFTATPTNGGTPTYQWKKNGLNFGSGANPFTTSALSNGDVITVEMTSTATCATGTPATSAGETISVIDVASITPAASVTAQPTCATPGGTIEVTSPLGAQYEYALNGGTYQSSPVFLGLSPGNYSATVRLAESPLCVSGASSSITISSTPSPLPAMTPVFVCQGGTGSLVSNNNCINNFVIPFNQNSIYFGWSASGDPTAAVPSGAVNTTICSFGGNVRTYSVVEFQVAVTGDYIFEMNDNPAYNGVGYIYTGTFTPGSCASGTLIRADSNSGTGDEPRLGGAGGAGAMTLTAGITYSLVSSTEGPTDITAYDYTWTITPPVGGNIMLNEPGDVEWYTSASGGSSIYTGQNFNPVGVAGSGLSNTNTSGTWTYYAACSSSPDCRTAADFTVTDVTTLFNITPGGATCFDASSPISVGISGSLPGMVYRLYRDGVYAGSQATGNGSAITVGNTSAAGIYTVVAVIGSTCVIPMNGTVEIQPVALAEAGPTVTLCTPTPPVVTLSGTSNLTTIAQEDFGNNIDDELTNTTSDWRIHYLYGSHPANRTQWHIGNATGSSTAPPYSISCAVAGAALTTVDRRQFQTDVPCDYAWDNGEMDEIAYKITPISAQLYTTVVVSFDYIAGGNYNASRNPQVTDYWQVVYSLDNGATWVAVNAGNNAGSFTLRNALNGTDNAFFSTTGSTVTGTANVTMPAAVAGQNFLLGFRWTNDGNRSGDNVGNMMIDNIEVTGDTDYDWSGPSVASGGNTPTPTVTAAGTYTLTVTAGNGCTSTDNVTVLPRADITSMTTSACSGSLFSVTPANGTNGTVPSGTTYSWSAPSVAGITGAAAGTNASSISGTLTNTTANAINVVYTVTPTANSCVSPNFNVTVTVNPTPSITTSPMIVTACSGSAFSVSPVNGTNGVIPAGTTYSWSAPTVTGGLGGGAAGSGASSITGNLTNPTASVQTATYTVVPSIGGGCVGSSFTVQVSVDPPVTLPSVITYAGVEPTCQLASSATTDYNSTVAVGVLEWSLTNITTTVGTLLPSAINSSTGVVTWPSGWSGSVTIRVRSTGCGTSGYVTRTVTLGSAIINPGFRTWTGSGYDQLWQNALNWDCGGVPTSADDVIIPEFPVAGDDETPIIKIGIIGYCNTIEVESNATYPTRLEIEDGGTLEVTQ